MSNVVDFTQTGVIGANLKPKRYDIELYQGDTFSFYLVLKDVNNNPLNITGWTGSAQIKKVSDSSAGETPTLTLAIGTTDGKVTVSLSSTETAALSGTTDYKYDIQLSDGSSKRTYIGGKITVTEDVTEP